MKNLTKRMSVLLLAFMLVLPVSSINIKATSSRVQELLDGMTLRQKITQMLMVDFRKWDEGNGAGEQDFTKMNSQVQKIVEDYDFGAVIYFANNIKTTKDTFNLSMELQKAATKDNGIPLIISADQEGGSVYRLGSGTALPGNMALGATGNIEYAKQAGQIIGRELSCLGINTNLAPAVDVNNNANNPVIGLRSFGDDATMVGEMASATIAGLKENNVIGCAKHFPGHGDTATDSHYGLPIVDKSKDVLMENELKPYTVAIDQGIEMIMTAHILYPQLDNSKVFSNKTGQEENLPATMSKAIITDLLKGEMGFEGVVSTDAMNMAGVANTFDQVQAVKLAISAGIDLICMPTVLYNLEDLKDLDAVIAGVEEAVLSGEIPESRLDDACTRILTLKEERGILDWKESDYSLDKALSIVGGTENRSLERDMAAAATTVIKNENNILPLKVAENEKVLMLCPYDNERAQMVMGWNRAKKAGLVPESAEVKVVRFASADLNAVKEVIDWADTIFINSEISTASRFSTNHWLYAGPEKFVNYAKENGKTAIVMSVDKPYDVQMYDNADAILAVYGCKGSSVDPTEAIVGGVTDSVDAYGPNIIAGIEVALGTYGAKGTLPVNVPKYDPQTGMYSDEVLYPRGYGLTYEAVSLVDKSELEDKVDEYDKVKNENYTEESWKAFQNALANAKEVLANSEDQASIDKALEALNKAFDSLKKVEEKPTTPVKPDGENPDTGDVSNAGLWLLMTLLAGGCVVSVRRKVRD